MFDDIAKQKVGGRKRETELHPPPSSAQG